MNEDSDIESQEFGHLYFEEGEKVFSNNNLKGGGDLCNLNVTMNKSFVNLKGVGYFDGNSQGSQGYNDSQGLDNSFESLKSVCYEVDECLDDESKDDDESDDGEASSNNDENELICKNMRVDINCDDIEEELKVLVNNCRGFLSKNESIQGIINELGSSIIFLTETHCLNKDRPRIPGFRTFMRNRELKRGGGVALCLKNNLCRNAVLLNCGDVAEMVVVKLEIFRPMLVLICFYGPPNKDKEKTQASFIELELEIEKYNAMGANLLIAGDFNSWMSSEVGDKDEEMSASGKKLKQIIDRNKLIIVNKVDKGKGTYFDHISKKKRTLDLVLTNNEDLVKEFETDGLVRDGKIAKFTPFSKRQVGKKKKRTKVTYSDHAAIRFKIEVKRRKCQKTKVTKKIRWKYNKKDGRENFKRLTDEKIHTLMKKIEKTNDVNMMAVLVEKYHRRIKFIAYGRQTVTARKDRRIRNTSKVKKIRSEVERIRENVRGQKDRLKVYKIKEEIDPKKDMNQPFTAMTDYETGERLEELDEVCNFILRFSVGALEKNGVVEDMKEVYEEREKFINNMWKEVREEDREITYEEYCRVVDKITEKDKDVYKDFIYSGEKFKRAMFEIINKIFKSGKVPESFKITYLTQIHKKGNMGDIRNKRLIHGKEWFSKIVEKLVVSKITRHVRNNTPDIQVGGMPNRGSRDNLLISIIAMREFERRKQPFACVLLDISKCFDKVKLSDLVYEALRIGCNPAVIKYIFQLSDETEIRLRGMNRDEISRIVRDSAGQGTDFAVVMTSYLMGMTMEKHLKKDGIYKELVKIGGNHVSPQGYVDDFKTMIDNLRSLLNTGDDMTKALDNVSLKANPDKSSVVVVGTNEGKRIEFENEINNNPMKIQGNDIKTKESDTYLGFKIHSKGLQKSYQETFEERSEKAWRKTFLLKKVLNHPAMDENGFVRSGATMFRSAIVPTLLYSSECWFGMNKGLMKKIETKYHKLLCNLMDIPESARYSAVLSELGLRKAETYIDSQKICFINGIINGGSTENVRRLLRDDKQLIDEWNRENEHLNITRKKPVKNKKSIIEEVIELCEKYGIGNITETEIDNEEIKMIIKKKADHELWLDVLEGKFTVKRSHPREGVKFYHRFKKTEGRAVLLWRIGALKFKRQWRNFYEKKKISMGCPNRFCPEEDTLHHAVLCPFMESKFKGDGGVYEDYHWARFLVDLSRERWETYKEKLL